MTNRLRLSPPNISTEDVSLKQWLNEVYNRVGSGPFMVPVYTKADLPDAAMWGDNTSFTSLIYVKDETGGAVLAFSNGTNWLRVTDRAIVS